MVTQLVPFIPLLNKCVDERHYKLVAMCYIYKHIPQTSVKGTSTNMLVGRDHTAS